jgi:hypothetical protein
MKCYIVTPDEMYRGRSIKEIKPELRVADDYPPSPFPSKLLLAPLPCIKFHFSDSQWNHKISTHMFVHAKPYITNYLHVATFLASKVERSSVFNHTTWNTTKEKLLSRTK